MSYGGGQLMDWIGHHNDCAHWGMNLDNTGPISVEASGFECTEDTRLWNAPVNYTVRSEYAEGFEIIISNRNKMGLSSLEKMDGSMSLEATTRPLSRNGAL